MEIQEKKLCIKFITTSKLSKVYSKSLNLQSVLIYVNGIIKFINLMSLILYGVHLNVEPLALLDTEGIVARLILWE